MSSFTVELGNWSPFTESERVETLVNDSKYYKHLAAIISTKIGNGLYKFENVYTNSYVNNCEFRAAYKRSIASHY